ncbi:hypothetical protein MKW94_017457 [Papaver nudicaule]|uniref:Dof zinc finger protein n=1 Tax=Papaver nudicaule TaxID=74823 RepID=A0AA41S0Q7_PAPNU|nr:hypothetical protein [Papaver nudicaule]
MSTDEHNQGSSGHSRKTTTSTVATLKPPAEHALKCPRCDSSNTKFCYYNNYSLTQPRHFCKTCRRYWTRGGALRNVPIGGGCRKNKKSTSSNTTKSSSVRGYSSDYSIHDSASSENGLKFFQHHAPSTMDFQLGGLSLSRLHHSSSTTGVYNQFAAAAASTSYGDMGYHTYPAGSSSSVLTNGGGGVQISQAEMASSLNIHSNLASSIESLSCVNQDLHWKLQQQRLGMLFGTGDQQMKEISDMNESHHHQKQKPLQPILFQNLEITKPDDQVTVAISKSGTADSIVVGGNGNHNNNNNINTSSEWFFSENTNYPPNTHSNNNNNSQENGVQTWVGLNHHQQQHHVHFTDQ